MEMVEAKELAKELMGDYLDDTWHLQINMRAKRILGQCKYRERAICLTGWYIERNSKEFVEDTILHEIAHALVGPNVKSHGKEWKYMARKLGARPFACKNVDMGLIPSKSKYIATCKVCDKVYRRHRLKKYQLSANSRTYCLCQKNVAERVYLRWEANTANQ